MPGGTLVGLLCPATAAPLCATLHNQRYAVFRFLQVSCFAVSKSGRYLASGQITFMGFTADIIIWDLETRTLLHRMGLHKVKVQALDFSHDDKYLASLGGQDDNNLVRGQPSSTARCTIAAATSHCLLMPAVNAANPGDGPRLEPLQPRSRTMQVASLA